MAENALVEKQVMAKEILFKIIEKEVFYTEKKIKKHTGDLKGKEELLEYVQMAGEAANKLYDLVYSDYNEKNKHLGEVHSDS